MSEPDNTSEKFLQRWSRRKQAAELRAPDSAEATPDERAEADANAPERAAANAEPDLPKFDPTLLPPIESITAASDVRVFLAPGVPEELTRAALRRAWATDPAIRDFVGLAENQWDFTNPDSIPGFGTLEFTDDIRRMVAGLVGGPPEHSAPRRDAAAEQSDQGADKPDGTVLESAADTAQKGPNGDPVPGRENLSIIADASANIPDVGPPIGDNDAAVQNDVGHATPKAVPPQQAGHRKHGGAVPK